MASLKKPVVCPTCGSTHLGKDVATWSAPHREGWYCLDCYPVFREIPNPDGFIVSRPKRSKDYCRVCNKTRAESEFKPGKNLCRECARLSHKQWRHTNADALKEYRSQSRVKEIRHKSVRKSVSRSPEAWIRNKCRQLLKPSNRKSIKAGHSEAILIVQVDFDYLWQTFLDQGRVCAITGLEMEHKPGSIRTMSIDRKDSSLGYIPGNIQIICVGVNLLKNKHSQSETLQFFNDVYLARKARDIESQWWPHKNTPSSLLAIGDAIASKLDSSWNIQTDTDYDDRWYLKLVLDDLFWFRITPMTDGSVQIHCEETDQSKLLALGDPEVFDKCIEYLNEISDSLPGKRVPR